MLSDLLSRVRVLLRRARTESDLDEELRFHLAQETEKYIAAGMPREEAARRARLALGGLEQTKEICRDARGVTLVETVGRDIAHAARVLCAQPLFTATVMITLSLGIGANVAIFTIDYATLLAPSPYPQSDRLVMVWSKLQGHRTWVSAADFTDWKRQNTVFQDLNAWSTDDFNIATRDRPEFVQGLEATPGYYGMLGNSLFLGRNFRADEGEPGREHVVILTHRLWQRLGANPKIVGRKLRINGAPYTVVGVTALGMEDRRDEELIVPLVFKPEHLNHDPHYPRYFVVVVGRLKPGVTIQQARADMEAVTAHIAKVYPGSNRDRSALVEPLKNDFYPGERQLILWLLLGAVGFLLLIACLNVVNLLLAKGMARHREVAIRGSLGAKPATIFAQFLTESLLLGFLGGLAGVAAGYAMLRGLLAAMPAHALPPEADPRLNALVLAFGLAVATLVGLIFGCVPAWYASRLDPAGILRDGGRAGIGVGRYRLRQILVIGEFALTLPLLAGAGLAIHSFWNLTRVDLGVRTDHVFGFYVFPLDDDPRRINALYHRILANIEAVPGVSDACAMTYLPLEGLHSEQPFTIAGQPAYTTPSLRPVADLQSVTSGYFRTFGIRILKGRAFTDFDTVSISRVALVNEDFASKFLKGVDPLQQRVVMQQQGPGKPGDAIEWQIVGVFHTVKSRESREDNPEIDIPFQQMGMAMPEAGIGVRTAQDPATMIKSVAAAVNAVDSQAAVYMPRTMEQVHDEVLANDRFTVVLFFSFAIVALLLAAVGIYGVMAFAVNQRSHEIALRMALGATRNRVLALAVRDGLVLAGIGSGLGLVGAYFVQRAMRGVLFGLGAIDFSAFGAVGLVLLFAALLACYLPARKAASVELMQVLKAE